MALAAVAVVLASCASPDDSESSTQPGPGGDQPSEVDFAKQPELAWTAAITDIQPGERFLSPHRMAAMYEVADAYEVDGTVIAAVREGPSVRLVGLDGEDGALRWNVALDLEIPEQPQHASDDPTLLVPVPQETTGITEVTCAAASLDGALPCVISVFDTEAQTRSASIHYFTLSEGNVVATVTADHADAVRVVDDTILTAGWAPEREDQNISGTITIARGTVADPAADWIREYPIAGICFGSGDGFTLGAFGDFVHFSSVSTVFVDADTGEPVVDGELSSISELSGDRFMGTRCEPSQLSPQQSPDRIAIVGDGTGQLLHEHPGLHSWNEPRIRTASDAPYIASYSVFDTGTGEETWRLPAGDTSQVVAVTGETLIAFQDSVDERQTVGYDLHTGDERWRVHGDDFYQYEGADGARVLGRGGADMNMVSAFDAATGAIVWSLEVPDGANLRIVSDGLLVATHEEIRYYTFG